MDALNIHFNIPKISQRPAQLAIAGITLSFAALALAGWSYHRAQQSLSWARSQQSTQSFIPVRKTALHPVPSQGLALLQNRQATRGMAAWRESLWLATEGGLVKLSPSGQWQRAYTVLDGLPESDLTACEIFQDQLWLGTRTQGLVAFDGARFTQYQWPQQDAQAVTALLNDQGRLLVGTFAGGLLAFDGARFQEIKTAEGLRLPGVTLLQRQGARLYVGTFAQGIWRNEGADWRHFSTLNGLLSNRVVGLSETAQHTFIATDFGIVESDESFANARPLLSHAALSGLTQWQGRHWAVQENGAWFEFVAGRTPQLIPQEQQNSNTAQTDTRWVLLNDAPWFLHSAGVARLSSPNGRARATAFGAFPANEAHPLADNLVSALSFDETGNLWAGTFRNGVTALDRNAQRTRFASEIADGEINALTFDASARQMLVATTQGLIHAKAQQTQLTDTNRGLPGNVVAAVSRWMSHERQPLALATNRGLALGVGKQWRVLTTVQGLPSNSTYAVQPLGRTLYVGTLSGLAAIENERVTRTFTTANSKLTNNWITALAVVDGRLFIGTYGGGVYALTPAGELVSFKAEFGNAFVNPNALASDGTRLLVGTLDGAFVWDAVTQRVQHFKRELPSAQVLSVAADEKHWWFGTTSGLLRMEKRLATDNAELSAEGAQQ